MRKQIIILINIIIILETYSTENKYTFDGDFTYLQVLKAIANQSSRSVLGSTEGLNIKRNFSIINKPFSIAIDQINKNLITDGYKIEYDENSISVMKLNVKDSLDIGKKIYEIYMPYQKKWMVTESKQDYLNAKQNDYEKHINDSIIEYNKKKKETDSIKEYINKNKIYKCQLDILGYTNKNEKNDGLDIDNLIKANVNLFKKFNVSDIGINLSAMSGKEENKLNFKRTIIAYCKGDSSQNLIFGSEVRRINSSFSNDRTISNNYESVYDGLQINISNSYYRLSYRVGENQIQLTGIPDSISYGSSIIDDKTNKKRFGIFRFKNSKDQLFTIISKMTVKEVIKNPQK